MGRNRVLSFMSAFGPPKSPQSTTFSGPQEKAAQQVTQQQQNVVTTSSPQHVAAPAKDSPPPRTRTERASSRPMSMVQTYQPPLMEIAQDTIPELQPIFTFLNSHANKLYQEGYFLKLNDLDLHGRPNADRSWTESFAQLVGTVLSLWDAAALDAAGQDGEVAPTFINLADASIKMIETLPTRSADIQPLQNVLSISTAGKNRYLFHFNSLHSLTQWTAAIRLAMYENATLQEAYTGSLIAGKGKLLNNIKVIMDRTRLKNEDWTRVRFGAGTPWRRCWCVITPPDEKDVQKQQKQLKKKSAYERFQPLKGNIKFYDTKKTKKTLPIATINDSYSAYAIYPQSKPLIDQSTLIKVEGSITIHSSPDITTEGFVFVMPEVHPAVSGFEMMLRYLFPVYDVFALYGRPTRLIADTLDSRSLMFALPQERRYGYLEILDVAGLIHETGSAAWSEREWRKKLKDLTSARLTRMTADGRPRSRASSYRDYRNSLPSRGGSLRYEDGASVRSTPSLHDEAPPMPPPHTNSTPPNGVAFQSPAATPTRPRAQHQRSFSEAYPGSDPRHRRSQRERSDQNYTPSRLSHEQSRPSFEASRSGRPSYEQGPPPPIKTYEQAPPVPSHNVPLSLAAQETQKQQRYASGLANDRSSSESERKHGDHLNGETQAIDNVMRPPAPPGQVAAPPAFSHEPGAKPQKRPGISPDLRRANSRLSITTLQQLADAGKNSTVGGGIAAAGAAAAWRSNSGSLRSGRTSEDRGQRGVIDTASKNGNTADRSVLAEGMVPVNAGSSNSSAVGARNVPNASSQPDTPSRPYYKDKPLMSSYDLLSPSNSISRTASPLSKSITPSPPPVTSDFENSRGTGFTEAQGHIVSATPASARKPPPVPPDDDRPTPTRSNTSHSIFRKPVPSRTPPSASRSRSPPKHDSPTSAAQGMDVSQTTTHALPRRSFDSLHDRYIDEDALAQVLDREHTRSITSDVQRDAQDDEASLYDNESTVSPDYASTRQSTDTRRSQRSIEKPRRGVLRTVGTAEPEMPKDVQVGDAYYRPGATPEPQISAAIPMVDFGPTKIYDPAHNRLPAERDFSDQTGHERAKSSDRGTLTPSPGNEIHMDHSPSSLEKPKGQRIDDSEPYSRQSLVTPEPRHRGPSPTDDNRRSIAWQPGTQIQGGSPGSRLSLTPEQFVQQRAAANRITPIYAHGRQNSSSSTPPNVSRQPSGEWPIQQPKQTRQKLQKRNSSYGQDAPSRPQSRAATNLINASADPVSRSSSREQKAPNRLQKRQSSYGNDVPSRPHSRATSQLMNVSGDYSAHLSAREQEHVARATGSPLINMSGRSNKHTTPQGGGLIGAIEAREKERKDIKEGLSGQMVQNAIAQQKQQHQQQRQTSYNSPPNQQYTTPQPQYSMPGGFPPSPTQYPSYPAGQREYAWNSPQQQHSVYQQPLQYAQPHWTPPSAGQLVGPQQRPPYQQSPQPQQGPYQQPHQYQQSQQQYSGGYFGYGQYR